MDTASDTQAQVIGIIGNKNNTFPRRAREWNKFHGDFVCGVFMHFISREISPAFKVVGPNMYIKGFPTEFDILIVDADAKPDGYVNASEPEKVRCGIESKARGTFGGREVLRKSLRRIKENFRRVNRGFPHVTFFYLTYQEVSNPKRKGSIDYLEETRKVLDPYKVFCLKESRSGKVLEGEWDKMLSFLNTCLYSQRIG